jgi:cytochrome P450
MQWVFYELSTNPQVQEKAYEEVVRVLNGRDPTYDDYDNLIYVNGVISEALRLHPPVPFIPKMARKDTVVNGTKIPKGTKVFLDTYSVHRSPSYWTDPDKFEPDRFNTEKNGKLVPFSYAPFALGARKCIGSFFSQLEMMVILSKLLQKYKIVALPETSNPIQDSLFVTLQPKNLHTKLVARQ